MKNQIGNGRLSGDITSSPKWRLLLAPSLYMTRGGMTCAPQTTDAILEREWRLQERSHVNHVLAANGLQAPHPAQVHNHQSELKL